MSSTLALIGGDEFSPGGEPIALELIARAGAPDARSLILPAAASLDNPYRAARRGTAWYQRLGSAMDHIMVVDPVTADYRHFVAEIERARFLYLLDGDAGYLIKTLRGSKAWAAMAARYRAGELVLAGSGAAASVLGAYLEVGGQLVPALNPAGLRLWVQPRANPIALPEWDRLPAGVRVLALPPRTAALLEGEVWKVIGAEGVTILDPAGAETHPPGTVFRI